MRYIQYLLLLVQFVVAFDLSDREPRDSSSVANTATANDSLHVDNRRWNIDYGGPLGTWYALGDSFSAGPGAGGQVDGDNKCKRNKNAYPLTLQNNWPNNNNHEIKFLSCTGAVIDDTIRDQLSKIEGHSLYATLSISGNDIGFSKILISCVAGLPGYGKCDDTISSAYNTLYSNELWQKYKTLTKTLLEDKLSWTFLHSPVPAVYQTSYPQFFEDWTQQCNDVSFAPFDFFGPKLTTELRGRLNDLQAELNTVIGLWIAEVNSFYYDRAQKASAIIYADQDEEYSLHRFCEYQIVEPSLDNPNIWYFPMRYRPTGARPTAKDLQNVDTSRCVADSGNDLGQQFTCGMAIALKENPGLTISDQVPTVLPDFLVKNFHPTVFGHDAVAATVSRYMNFRPNENNHPIPLRIMAVGDSITDGFRSSDGNGYRRYLHDLLTHAGYSVTWVGPQTSGTAPTDHHLGLSGRTAAQIGAEFIVHYETYKPNLVLLMAGTNDVNQKKPIPQTVDAFAAMFIHASGGVADLKTPIIVSHMPPVGGERELSFPLSQSQRSRVIINGQITRLVNKYTSGASIAVGGGWRPQDFKIHKVHSSVNFGSMSDNLHPNDKGYELIGHDFFEGIVEIEKRNWLTRPVASDEHVRRQCKVKPLWFPQGEIANGAGLGRDAFPDIICTPGETSGDNDGTQKTCDCKQGDGIALQQFLVGDDCSAMSYHRIRATQFADLDGDGRDEYLHIGENGEVRAFYNQGSKSGSNSFNGSQVGWWDAGIIASGVGAQRHEVIFADLNGDGRAEYIWVHQNGSASVWLNQGKTANGKTPANVGWFAQGIVATGIGKPGAMVRFADLNGDGRAEYLAFDKLGGVDVYLNLGPAQGTDPRGAKVAWLPQKKTATGVGGKPEQIYWGDMNGDGRADYLYVHDSGEVEVWQAGSAQDEGPHAGERVWIKEGSVTGGDGTPGDHLRFADLNGDGRVEYLEVDPDTSAVKAYQNGCPEGQSS